MKDLVIMAVIDNDFIDWSKLSDSNKGRLSRKLLPGPLKKYLN